MLGFLSSIKTTLAALVLLFASAAYLLHLRGEVGELEAKLAAEQAKTAAQAQLVLATKKACDDQILAIQKLEQARTRAKVEIDAFDLRIDTLSPLTEPADGTTDPFVDGLNSLNDDINRMLRDATK